MAPPSGTKGFGGTEGFMAPEIMRYNGEEEYNEKVTNQNKKSNTLVLSRTRSIMDFLLQVDCFSYGMLLYEVLTLRQPFEGHEAVKEAVLEGARPALTTRVGTSWIMCVLFPLCTEGCGVRSCSTRAAWWRRCGAAGAARPSCGPPPPRWWRWRPRPSSWRWLTLRWRARPPPAWRLLKYNYPQVTLKHSSIFRRPVPVRLYKNFILLFTLEKFSIANVKIQMHKCQQSSLRLAKKYRVMLILLICDNWLVPFVP